MSHIPPLVCNTPPPIDFADSQEDYFGDYDGLSLPTTPKQTLSTNNDLPELPEFSNVADVSLTALDKDFQDLNDSRDYANLSLPNVLEFQSNNSSINQMPPPLTEPSFSNSKIENLNSSSETNEDEALEKFVPTDAVSNSPIKHFNKLSIGPPSLDNSMSSQSHSNDNVYRSESPPSLVFSTGSLNCDDSRSEDFDEFTPNVDEIESNFPSLKLGLIGDSKSQSSDLEEVNNSVVGEKVTNDIKNDDEIKVNEKMKSTEILNSFCEAKINKEVESESVSIVNNGMTNYDDSFDDFVDSFDDFVEYEEVITKDETEEQHHHQEGRDQSEEIKFCDENSFAADFSQFEAFSEQKMNEPLECNSKGDPSQTEKLSADHLHQEEALTLSKSSISADNFHEHDDDEFGEFNDFSDFSQPISAISSLTIDIEELSTKIKPLLDMLFPVSDSESEDGSFDALDLTNCTTKIIKDFENSKALDHQWISSVGKSSLVTALGIDSRNILYGGKWNNSMPRFAANLGFSPLEPIKPGTVSGTTSSIMNAVSSNEIPAAQFDWNSSGLVNPLDASHAHTLLLDLEQLVVVANLDKIKLDSSTCSSTTVPVTTNSTTNNNSMSSPNNHYIHNWDADGVGYQYDDFYGNSLPYSCETNIKTLEKNTNHFGLFDQFLDIRVQEILHKTNVAENQSSRTELDWNSTKTEPSIIAPAPSNITTTLNIKTNSFVVDEEETQTSASYVVPGSSGTLKETHIFTPSKSSYTIPQSREVPNDKHEPKFVDFDYEEAAAGIIIDENVVKKEYRDVEYNPDRPVTSTLSCDDFSDFQSVPIPIITQIPQKQQQNILPIDFGILQPTKPNDVIMINWPDPGNVIDSTDLESFDNFNKPVEQPFSDSKRSSIDFTSIGKSKSSTSTFSEFSKPVIGVSPSDVMFQKNSSSLEDEFSDFQCVEPIPSIVQHMHTDSICNNLTSPLQDSIPSLTVLSNKSDDISTVAPNVHSWTNYQSPMSTTTTNVPAANILKPEPLQSLQILTPQPVNPSTLPTNTIWPESEIDPDEIARLEAIFPQAQKSTSNPLQASPFNHANAESKLENRIPQPSTLQEDDEWSDFVSVQTPASQTLPITNIISANIAKHQQDDDEWSDFVSSVSSASQPSIQSWNLNSGPNFTSWNAPPQFDIDLWQSSTMYQPSPHQFVPTIPTMMNNNNNATTLSSHQSTSVNTKSSQNSFFTQKAPSISLIPDLSFVAAKSLVNRSRTNFQNK